LNTVVVGNSSAAAPDGPESPEDPEDPVTPGGTVGGAVSLAISISLTLSSLAQPASIPLTAASPTTATILMDRAGE
jgi:hypothetical protein